MKQLFFKSINEYRIKMEDKGKAIERLALEVPSQQQQAMRSLESLDPTKPGHMISEL